MKILRATMIVVLLGLSGLAPALRAENGAAVNEVLKLRDAGLSEDTIVSFIESKNLGYDLSADDVIRLRQQGVPASVVNAMLASGRSRIAPKPNPAPSAAEPPAVVPTATVPSPAVVVVPAAPAPATVPAMMAAPPAANPDVAYFRQELSPYGRWILVEDGQWCWQPSVAMTTPEWRPYWDRGGWVWTDQGWFWRSDYSWGWAAFHYGRWHLHPHHGWVWFPDRVWGPAWVVWRTGGEYCGWAPLPPGAVYDTVGGRFIFRGRQVAVGFDFGLGPAHFSFCLSKELGEPIRRHYHPEPAFRIAFEHSRIHHDYTVRRIVVGGESRVQIFNHGLEPDRIEGHKAAHREAVHIEDLRTPAPGRSHERLDRQNRTLEVYRPRFGGHR